MHNLKQQALINLTFFNNLGFFSPHDGPYCHQLTFQAAFPMNPTQIQALHFCLLLLCLHIY